MLWLPFLTSLRFISRAIGSAAAGVASLAKDRIGTTLALPFGPTLAAVG